LASDLVEIGKLNGKIKFELGTPFQPYQQLLSVLPARSSHMLPKTYQHLMLSESSPIIEYYPVDFPIDKEGTKYDYEGVVILPFINETKLIDAMKDIEITDLEKERNTIGNTLMFSFDSKQSTLVKSTLPNYISDISNCHVVEKIFKIPSEKAFKPVLLEGTKLHMESLEGFPTFALQKIHVEEKVIGINLFGYPSKKLSLVVNVLQSDETAESKDFKDLIGKSVFIGYPYCKEVSVSSVCDINESHYESKSEKHSKAEKEQFTQETKYHQRVLRSRYGIQVEHIDVLIYVKLFKELRKNVNGSLTKVYHQEEFAFPSNFLAPKDYKPRRDVKFMEKKALTIQQAYPLESKLICLNEEYFGRMASIIDYKDRKLNVRLESKMLHFDENLMKKEIDSYVNEKYFPLSQIATKLKLHSKTLVAFLKFNLSGIVDWKLCCI
jgi:5'-3' exoribonuclease 1